MGRPRVLRPRLRPVPLITMRLTKQTDEATRTVTLSPFGGGSACEPPEMAVH